jgi:hypothetical protein
MTVTLLHGSYLGNGFLTVFYTQHSDAAMSVVWSGRALLLIYSCCCLNPATAADAAAATPWWLQGVCHVPC